MIGIAESGAEPLLGFAPCLRIEGAATTICGDIPGLPQLAGRMMADASAGRPFRVVLLTPDEVAYLLPAYTDDPSQSEPRAQARPNVLFEAGMAMGRAADRVVLIELGEVRPFSDVAGRHMVRLNNTPEARAELAGRLETAGCPVDRTGHDWLTAGDFTPPPPPGGGLPLGRRVPSVSARNRVKIDLRYHSRAKGGRLEVINSGTEAVYDLNLTLPEEASGFELIDNELPLKRLPPGKSASLYALTFMGRSSNHFDVHVTGRTESGEDWEDDVFLSVTD